MSIRAHFDGKVFIPVDRVDLPKDQIVELDVHTTPATQPGSPSAVLDLMDRMAPLSTEVIDELERAIESTRVPTSDRAIFDDQGT